MPVNDIVPGAWLERVEKRIGRPISLLKDLAWIVGLLASAWFLIANLVGIEPSLLWRTLFRDILPFVILYSAAALLTVREALHWYRHAQPKWRRPLTAVFGVALATIMITAYGDLRIRSRESLVTNEIGKMRAYGCSGNYERSLRTIDRLANSPRFNFLRADLRALANHERFLAHLKSGFAPTVDAVALEERRLLFGLPNRTGRPLEIRAALWRRWQDAIRPECR
jgi:hypothetical protein